MTQTETPPEMIVDSHHHFWDVGKLDYPWMPRGEGVLRRNYLPAHLAPILERNGVSRTVLVQANQTPAEAGFLLDLAEATDFVAGAVVWVDLTSPDVGKVLDDLGRRPKLVGVRHQVHDEPDDAWLIRDDVVRGLEELGRRGLTYDLLLRPQHIKYVAPLVERVPDLRMVVDHIAKPLIASGVIEPWATDMASVAAIPGLYCKVSGMVTEADHSRWTADDLKPYVSHVVELFGYGRLMWGSDWPACLRAATYHQVLRATRNAVGPISGADKARLMGQNAADFYRL